MFAIFLKCYSKSLLCHLKQYFSGLNTYPDGHNLIIYISYNSWVQTIYSFTKLYLIISFNPF